MVYDVAAKVLIEKCRNEILRRFLHMPVDDSSLVEEVPQETVSLRRADFAIRVTAEGGASLMVLLEIQSRWDEAIPLRLLEYRTRYILKYGLETISSVLLLTESPKVVDAYRDNEVEYRFRQRGSADIDGAAHGAGIEGVGDGTDSSKEGSYDGVGSL